MLEQEGGLENYISDVLDGKDSTFNYLSLQYRDRYITMVKRLDVSNPNVLSNSLELVAEELFNTKNDHVPYISSFLLFSIEVDKYCMDNHN